MTKKLLLTGKHEKNSLKFSYAGRNWHTSIYSDASSEDEIVIIDDKYRYSLYVKLDEPLIAILLGLSDLVKKEN